MAFDGYPVELWSEGFDQGFGNDGDAEAAFDEVEEGVGVVDLELLSGLDAGFGHGLIGEGSDSPSGWISDQRAIGQGFE